MNRRQFLIGAAVAAVLRPALPQDMPLCEASLEHLLEQMRGEFDPTALRFKVTERFSHTLELREVLVEIQHHGPQQTQVQPERFRDPTAWYIKTEHSNGLKTYKRRVQHTVLDDPLAPWRAIYGTSS
jgi:hypothetical protein